jgi:nitronate monooxygenase
VATAGYGQHRKDGAVEQPLVTSGDDLAAVGQLVPPGRTSYTAADVLRFLLGPSGLH